MNLDTLAKLPDWPALMDSRTAISYLGGSLSSLRELEKGGYLRRYSDGPRNVRYTRKAIDLALAAKAVAISN